MKWIVVVFLVAGCGLVPVSPQTQGAQIADQQGQVGETGSATTFANPIFVCPIGAKSVKIKQGVNGLTEIEVTAAEGDVTITGDLIMPTVTYEGAELSSDVSSGGAGQAAIKDGP